MVWKAELADETKNFWVFEVKGKKYDILKSQLAGAFQNLYFWLTESGSNNFSSKLYDLLAKADSENFEKLFNGFPVRTIAYMLWFYSADKTVLFEKYGDFKADESDTLD